MRTFLATKTAEADHPNATGKLKACIDKEIETAATIKALHEQVYKALSPSPQAERNLFQFRHTVTGKNNQVDDISVSKKLLWWLVANKHHDVVIRILQKYHNAILTLDRNKNNILHIAAFYGDDILIKAIVDHFPTKSARLINHRNNDGTTPLGMVFINPPNFIKNPEFSHAVTRVACLFLQQQELQANAYLNNRSGMDYKGKAYLQEIGGFNLLHMVLIYGLMTVLKACGQRHINFRFPAMNPAFHMTSPQTLLALSTLTIDIKQAAQNLLQALEEKQSQQEDADLSGGSSDEESAAFYYKESLLGLQKKIETAQPLQGEQSVADVVAELNSIATETQHGMTHERELRSQQQVNAMLVPHFHGVPFMAGHYTHRERREIAKKILSTNNNTLEAAEQLYKGLHSRTSTASVGFENIYAMITAPDFALVTLNEADEELKRYLSECWQANQTVFLAALRTYVYDFSRNPIATFWDTLAQVKVPPPTIVKYRFPFISASKAPDHAVKFAFGHNVETQTRGERPFLPQYDSNARPRHRLAGFLYVTLHTVAEITAMDKDRLVADMPKLIKHDLVASRNVRTNFQIETTFLGGVPHTHVVAVIPMVYPNLSKSFEAGYHDSIWGLMNASNRQVNAYVNARNTFQGKQGAIPLYESSITTAGKILMSAYVQFAIRLTEAIARSQGKQLCYLSADDKLQPYPIGYESGAYFSTAQTTIRAAINPRTGAYQERRSPDRLFDKNIFKLASDKEAAKKLFLDALSHTVICHLSANQSTFMQSVLGFLVDTINYTTKSGEYSDGMQYKIRKEIATILAALAKLNNDFLSALLLLLKQNLLQFFLENSILTLGLTGTDRKDIIDEIEKYANSDSIYIKAYAVEALIRLGVVRVDLIQLLEELYQDSYFSRYWRLEGDPDEGQYESYPESPQGAISQVGEFNKHKADEFLLLLSDSSDFVTIDSIEKYCSLNSFSKAVADLLVSYLNGKVYQLAADAKQALKYLVSTESSMRKAVEIANTRGLSKVVTYSSIVTESLFTLLEKADVKGVLQLAKILKQAGCDNRFMQCIHVFWKAQASSWHESEKYLFAMLYLQLGYININLAGVMIGSTDESFHRQLDKVRKLDIAEAGVIDFLVEKATSDHRAIRCRAIRLLGKMPEKQDIMDCLYACLGSEDDNEAYFYVAQSLFQLKDDSFALMHALSYVVTMGSAYRGMSGLAAAGYLIQLGVVNTELLAFLFSKVKSNSTTVKNLLGHIPSLAVYVDILDSLIDIEQSIEREVNRFQMDNSVIFTRIAKRMFSRENDPDANILVYLQSILGQKNAYRTYHAIYALLRMSAWNDKAFNLLSLYPEILDDNDRVAIAGIHINREGGDPQYANTVLNKCLSGGFSIFHIESLGRYLIKTISSLSVQANPSVLTVGRHPIWQTREKPLRRGLGLDGGRANTVSSGAFNKM